MSERDQDVRRAREILNGAGWVFDKYVDNEMAKILTSASSAEQRELHYLRARVATEMKAELLSVVESWDFDTKMANRREEGK
jgi:hypothetical protein